MKEEVGVVKGIVILMSILALYGLLVGSCIGAIAAWARQDQPVSCDVRRVDGGCKP